jgi:hypothetical protein
MARTGKKSSAKKPTAKRRSYPLPPASAKWFAKLKTENEAYWAKNSPGDWASRSITRYLAQRDLGARQPQPQSGPKPKETAASWVDKAVVRHPKPEPNWTDARYAQYLQLLTPDTEKWDWRTIANELSKRKPKPPPG